MSVEHVFSVVTRCRPVWLRRANVLLQTSLAKLLRETIKKKGVQVLPSCSSYASKIKDPCRYTRATAAVSKLLWEGFTVEIIVGFALTAVGFVSQLLVSSFILRFNIRRTAKGRYYSNRSQSEAGWALRDHLKAAQHLRARHVTCYRLQRWIDWDSSHAVSAAIHRNAIRHRREHCTKHIEIDAFYFFSFLLLTN